MPRVFQWVKSALRHLDSACVNPNDVKASLDSLHQDIFGTYQSIIQHLLLTKTAAYERKRIQAALMWLCAAARPLNTSELLTLALLGNEFDSVSSGQVEQPRSSNREAAEELKALLGSTIEIIDRGNGELVAKLIHATFKDYLTTPEMRISPHDQIQVVGFTAASAESSLCPDGHSQSARSPALASREGLGREDSLSSWTTHGGFGHTISTNPVLVSTILLWPERWILMLQKTSAESLSFLVNLASFLCQRYSLEGVDRKGRLHFVRAFQQAQQALVPPIKEFTVLRTMLPISKRLQHARDSFLEAPEDTPDDGPIGQAMALMDSFWRQHSRITTLDMDEFLRSNMRRLGKEEDCLARVARQLRVLAATISINPIYGELTAGNPDLVPVTFLVHVSNSMESIASFAYWSQIPPTSDPVDAFDTESDDRYELHAEAVLQRFAVAERLPPIAAPGPGGSNKRFYRHR